MAGSLWDSLEEALCPCLAKSCLPCQSWTAASGWSVSATSAWFPLTIQRAPTGCTRFLWIGVCVNINVCCSVTVGWTADLFILLQSQLFSKINIPESGILTIDCSLPVNECAEDYTRKLKEVHSDHRLLDFSVCRMFTSLFSLLKHTGLPRWWLPCVWPIAVGNGAWWTHLFSFPRPPSSGGEGSYSNEQLSSTIDLCWIIMKKNECRYKITAFLRKESFIVNSKHVFYFVTQYVIVILKTMFRALKMHFGRSSKYYLSVILYKRHIKHIWLNSGTAFVEECLSLLLDVVS